MKSDKQITATGNSIKYWRDTVDMSQGKLAELIGINRSWMSAIENGLMQPSPELIEKICKALDKPPTLVFKFK